MPWIHLIERTHNCPIEGTIPPPRQTYEQGASIGSVYECDSASCSRRFMLKDSQRDGIYWEALPTPFPPPPPPPV